MKENPGFRLLPLDALRGIAALGVAIFWHYQHFNMALFQGSQKEQPYYQIFYWFYRYGANLVDFFFVLSGFVFMHVYSEKIAAKKISLADFSILRLSRLYPLHLLTLVYVFLFQHIRLLVNKEKFFIYDINDGYHFVLNTVFFQSGFFDSGYSFNGPSWSISIEFFAYMLFFYLLIKFKKPLFLFAFCVFIGLFIVKTRLNYPGFNSTTSRVFIGFFIGCLTFIANKKIAKDSFLRLSFILTAAFVSIVSIALSIGVGYEKFVGDWRLINALVVYPAIILLALNINLLGRILSVRPLTYLGDISFTVYMLHFPVQLSIVTFCEFTNFEIDYRTGSALFMFAFLTIVSSVIVHHLFEIPIQNYIRTRYIKR